MTGVQRASWVRTDELNIHGRSCAAFVSSIAVAGFNHLAKHVVEPRVGESKVDESGAGDLDALNVVDRLRFELGDEPRGEFSRVRTRSLRARESNVGRPVPVVAIRRLFETDLSRLGEPLGIERRGCLLYTSDAADE